MSTAIKTPLGGIRLNSDTALEVSLVQNAQHDYVCMDIGGNSYLIDPRELHKLISVSNEALRRYNVACEQRLKDANHTLF